jgi:hypothetical protein
MSGQEQDTLPMVGGRLLRLEIGRKPAPGSGEFPHPFRVQGGTIEFIRA